MDRRSFLLKSSALLSTPLLSSIISPNAVAATSSGINHLAIPELLQGTNFNLSLQAGSKEFLSGKVTDTYGINGSYLGPAIKVRKGDLVSLNVTNNLGEASTLHWHGMHVPGNMDGGPHQLIQPGSSWLAQYTINQQAGTNWYHPHQEGSTGSQVYKGLAGLMIVEDELSDSLDLPKEWGEDDIPLVIQDRRFADDGSFEYVTSQQDIMQGMQGNVFLVNGTANAYVDLPNKEVRFRILNGSNARVYHLQFSDQRTFKHIATDSGFREQSTPLNALILSPGERAEIVVDYSSDTGQTFQLIDVNNNNTTLLTLGITKQRKTSTKTPENLAALTRLNPADAVTARTFTLGMGMGMGRGGRLTFTINGKEMDMSRIDHIVPLNDIEVWEIRNNTGMTHNFHMHATHFQIVERNGSSANVAAYENGYKDVVLLRPFESAKVITKMTDYTTGASAPYMFHCHILEHEDRGMMGQFTVA